MRQFNTGRHGSIDYNNDEIRRAFVNRTYPGSAYSMNLVELPDGTFALLDYDWAKIAEQNEDGRITVYAGWSQWAQRRFELENRNGGEATTRRHVRELVEYLIERGRAFEVSEERPEVGAAPKCLRELGNLDMIPYRGAEPVEEVESL